MEIQTPFQHILNTIHKLSIIILYAFRTSSYFALLSLFYPCLSAGMLYSLFPLANYFISFQNLPVCFYKETPWPAQISSFLHPIPASTYISFSGSSLRNPPPFPPQFRHLGMHEGSTLSSPWPRFSCNKQPSIPGACHPSLLQQVLQGTR